MEHVGIDLGATKCHIMRLSATGEVLERSAVGTGTMELWLRGLEPSRVVMEACTQSPAMARLAQQSGHVVVVVPGTLVRTLGVGARGIKTDDRDAEVLARASLRIETLPSVHLRSEAATHQRELVSTRSRLVKLRAQVAVSVKCHLRGQLIGTRGRASSKTFCETVRSLLLKTKDGMPSHIETLLKTFEFLTERIDELQGQIEKIARENEVCRKLMTIPGVGPHVALSFMSTIDEVSRFENADKLGSFLALTPGENTTGGKIRRTRTIHAGPVWLKAALVQSAWSMWRTTPQAPMVLWAKSIAEKRGKRIAIVALARKLATVMWAMWKRNETYHPERASSVREPARLESRAMKKETRTSEAVVS